MPRITWDKKTLRYRNGGRFVSKAVVVAELESARTKVKAGMVSIAARLMSGDLKPVEAKIEGKALIKAMHVLAGGIARGGKAQLGAADLGRIGAETRKQYDRWGNLWREVESGAQKLNGRLTTRLMMYVDASHATYTAVERGMFAEAGFELARRVYNPDTEACAGCKAAGVPLGAPAGKGWQPIAKVKPIGSQQCLTNCRCALEYKHAA